MIGPLALIIALIGLVLAVRATAAKKNGVQPPPILPPPGDVIVDPVKKNDLLFRLDQLFIKHGQQSGVEPALLKAIAIVESDLSPGAINLNDPSVGLMQILCRGDGGDNLCTNRFNIVGWETATFNKLLDPDFNLTMAGQILKWNIDTYGFNRGIAIYNRWASRLDPEIGPFGNQSYVDKVLVQYVGLKNSGFGR